MEDFSREYVVDALQHITDTFVFTQEDDRYMSYEADNILRAFDYLLERLKHSEEERFKQWTRCI